MHPSFFSLLPLFLFLVFLLKWFFKTPTIHKSLPPSPSKLPIIGNLHQLGSSPHRSLQSLAQKHGPLMLLHLGSVPVLIISSADAAREIMKTHDLIFSNRPKLSIPNRLLYHSKDVSFAPYSEYWRQVKSMCVLKLLSNKRVQSFKKVREEEITIMVEKIKNSCSSSSSLANLSEIFMSLTNDVVCRVALGRKYGQEIGGRNFFKEVLKEFDELLGVFNVGDYIPWLAWVNKITGLDAKVEKVAKGFDEFLEDVVKEHLDRKKREINGGESVEGEGQDFVDILLEVERDNMIGFPIERDTVKALLLDMFAAGTDTSYALLEWTMTDLLKHPEVMKKLQNEVKEISRGKSEITEDDLEKMQYLKAVIKESLRLHPPIPLLVPRESTQYIKIMGYNIAARTQVIINAWAIARDPISWDEPDEFWPERFLNSCIDFKGHHFEFIPFGAGRRGCPGIQFAASVVELALANLMYKFDFALPNGAKWEDLDTTETSGITIRRKTPLLVIATCAIQSQFG